MAAIDWAELGLNHWGKILSVITMVLSVLGYGNIHQFFQGKTQAEELKMTRNQVTAVANSYHRVAEPVEIDMQNNKKDVIPDCSDCKALIKQHEKRAH